MVSGALQSCWAFCCRACCAVAVASFGASGRGHGSSSAVVPTPTPASTRVRPITARARGFLAGEGPGVRGCGWLAAVSWRAGPAVPGASAPKIDGSVQPLDSAVSAELAGLMAAGVSLETAESVERFESAEGVGSVGAPLSALAAARSGASRWRAGSSRPIATLTSSPLPSRLIRSRLAASSAPRGASVGSGIPANQRASNRKSGSLAQDLRRPSVLNSRAKGAA